MCNLLRLDRVGAGYTSYERATALSDKYRYLAVNVPEPARSEDSYRASCVTVCLSSSRMRSS